MVVQPAGPVDLCGLGVGGGVGVVGRGPGGCFLAGPDLLGALPCLFLERGFLAGGVTHVNSRDSVDRHRLRRSSWSPRCEPKGSGDHLDQTELLAVGTLTVQAGRASSVAPSICVVCSRTAWETLSPGRSQHGWVSKPSSMTMWCS